VRAAGGGGEQASELLGEVEQDRAAFEHPLGIGRVAAVEERGDLAVGTDRDEARAELLALADFDQPGVIFRADVAKGEQFLEHDRHLDPVGGAEAVELERVVADREFAVVGRAGGGAVDAGELAAAGLGPGPDFGRGVRAWGRSISGVVGHAGSCRSVAE